MDFIRNGWYAASLSESVTTKPVREVMFGTPVALYRTESGQAVALQDRCPHRFVPLHMGMVVGEELECPYHGLRFGTHGGCTLNPHGDRKIPAAARVESYPIVERDGVVWIWPGDPSLADEAQVKDLAPFLGDGKWTVIGDSFLVNANAGIVLDNVMDVSHAPFIHRTTFANAENVDNTVFEMKQEGNRVTAYTTIYDSKVTPLFAPFWKSPSPNCDSIAHMSWEAPLNAFLEIAVTEVGAPFDAGLRMHVMHLLRPVDEHHTRYFWLLGRNFAIGVDKVSEVIKEKINHGFLTEDEPAVSACAKNMGTTDLMSLKPILLAGDAAAIRTRRVIEQMFRAENAAATEAA